MTFLHPILFAAGLAAVAIPILIHLLLRQRRKPVMWGAMRFLIEAYRRQRKRLRIEQLLLLATRCLLVAAVGSALARPLMDAAGLLAGQGGRAVYILLDTGLAATVREGSTQDSSALARHKAAATELLSSLGPADRAGLILLGAPAQGIVLPASADIAAVRRLVEDAQPTDAATDLDGAFRMIGDAAGKSEEESLRPTTVVILSDFMLGSADLSRPLAPSLGERNNVSIMASRPADASASPSNVQITAVEPLRPLILTGGRDAGSAGGEREQVRILLRRSGPAVAEGGTTTARVRTGIEGPDGPVSQGIVRWQPGQVEAGVFVQISAAAKSGDAGQRTIVGVEIDRDALPGDNIFRRPIGVRESLRVGVAARARFGADLSIDRLGPADWIRLALRPSAGSPIDTIEIDPSSIDAAVLAAVDVLFVPAPDLIRDEDWSRLRRFVEAGGLLVVSPAAEATVHLWTDAMARDLGLAWRLAREPRDYDTPMTLDDQRLDSPMLSLIAAELPGLVKAVSVFRGVPPEDLGRQAEVLLRLKDGSPWVVADEPGSEGGDRTGEGSANGKPRVDGSRGLVIYLASAPALAWTDLPAKPLMVPLMQELSRQGFGRAAGSWAARAGGPVALPARTASLRARSGDGAGETMGVSPAGFSAEPIRRAGLWTALDEAGRPRGIVAVNADTDAGRTTPQDPAAVRSWLGGIFGAAESSLREERVQWFDRGGDAPALAATQVESPFSVPLLAAAMALALIELVMARFFSHAFAR